MVASVTLDPGEVNSLLGVVVALCNYVCITVLGIAVFVNSPAMRWAHEDEASEALAKPLQHVRWGIHHTGGVDPCDPLCGNWPWGSRVPSVAMARRRACQVRAPRPGELAEGRCPAP